MGQDSSSMSLLRASTATDLRPSFYNKRSPFSLLQESDFDRTSMAVGYWMSFYDDRTPIAGFLQRSIASDVCRISPTHPKPITGRPSTRSFIKSNFPNGSSSGDFPHRTNPRRTSLAIGFLPGFANEKSLSELLQQVTPTCSINA